MRRVLIVVAALGVPLLVSGVAVAGTLSVNVCGSYSGDAGPFQPAASRGLVWTASCSASGALPGLQLTTPSPTPTHFHVPQNASGSWTATAPAGITITHIRTWNADSYDIGDRSGYYGEFYWSGGGPTGRVQINDNFVQSGCCQANFNDQHVGWFFVCAVSAGCSNPANIQVGQIQLTATENQGPRIVPIGALWSEQGWVRATMPVGFWDSDPSGVCSTKVILGSQTIAGPGGTPNTDTWHQCPDQIWSTQIDTRASQGSDGLGEGSMPLVLTAANAAEVGAWAPEIVHVDNQTPTVSMSGPTDASASAGTQYIAATASAGPSGIAGISCSVDGAPYQWHPGASAELPVAGVGTHTATCIASNNARDAAGKLATSLPASWSLTIRQPTVSAIGFSKLVDALRCRRVRERIAAPAKWVTVRRHGKPVKVKRRSHTKVIHVVRCHPRVVRVRVRVNVKGHWRWQWERKVRLPHSIQLSTWRARYGATANVLGWLGTSDGVALAGQTIRILTAPDNGLNAFTQATVATSSDGAWSARLPAGPSRLVQAVYDGANTLEAASSGRVRLIVPALVKLTIRPRRTHWWWSPRSPGTIQISGRVLGGYIPGADQQLLRLRIGVVGVPGVQSTIGIPDIRPDGRFHTTWTPAPGNGTVHFWFSVSTLHEADFPFAPASSRRVDVIVQ